MTKDQYERLSAPFRTPRRRRLLNAVNAALTVGTYAFYLLLCLYALLRDRRLLLPALLIPGIPFVLVSLYRARVNAPRPYEALDIEPLIRKDTRGRSFPSRHVFSMFVIGMTAMPFSRAAAVIVLACGGIMALIRVIGGVHHPRDVIWGAVMGVLSGAAGLFLCAYCGLL